MKKNSIFAALFIIAFLSIIPPATSFPEAGKNRIIDQISKRIVHVPSYVPSYGENEMLYGEFDELKCEIKAIQNEKTIELDRGELSKVNVLVEYVLNCSFFWDSLKYDSLKTSSYKLESSELSSSITKIENTSVSATLLADYDLSFKRKYWKNYYDLKTQFNEVGVTLTFADEHYNPEVDITLMVTTAICSVNKMKQISNYGVNCELTIFVVLNAIILEKNEPDEFNVGTTGIIAAVLVVIIVLFSKRGQKR